MRPGHRGTRQVAVASVAAVQGRAHVYPRCGNIRLKYVGRVESARSAAAEAGQRVGYTNRPSGKGSLVDRRRVGDAGAAGAGVASGNLDEDTRGLSVVDDRLQLAPSGAALAGRATPTVIHNVGPKSGIGILAVQISGRDEELEALAVGGRGADAYVHVAAADPLRPGGYSDLVARPVVA